MAKSAESLPFFFGCYANVSVFSREIEEPPPPYLSSKNKKIRDRVDSRVQLVWRLRVMGSWVCVILRINLCGMSGGLIAFKLDWRQSNVISFLWRIETLKPKTAICDELKPTFFQCFQYVMICLSGWWPAEIKQRSSEQVIGHLTMCPFMKRWVQQKGALITD